MFLHTLTTHASALISRIEFSTEISGAKLSALKSVAQPPAQVPVILFPHLLSSVSTAGGSRFTRMQEERISSKQVQRGKEVEVDGTADTLAEVVARHHEPHQ